MPDEVTMRLVVLLVALSTFLPHTTTAQTSRTTRQPCPYRRDGTCYEILDDKGRVIGTEKQSLSDKAKWEFVPDPVNGRPTRKATPR